MSDIALTVSILALVAVVGLFIGNVKFRGIGLGIGGVLFGGIIVGHFVSGGDDISSDMLHVIQEFGLILFVYTIGIQVGPGFFASLRVSGLRLNLFAVLIVIIGGLVTAILHKLFDIPLPVVLGIFSGAVTNTPALGAGRQKNLRDLGTPMEMVDQMGMSYAMAYPFRHLRDIVHHVDVRVIFRVNVETEAQQHESSRTNGGALIKTINIRVENPNLHDLAIKDVPILNGDKIICSRLKRETLKVPSPDTTIQLGDLLHLVGQPADLHNAQLVIGQEVDTSLSTKGTDLRVERVVVTNENVLGKRIRDLHFKERYDVVISRLNRAGVELVASGDISLQFGDILNLVGRPSAIDAVANVLGNAAKNCNRFRCCQCLLASG
ncbi:putative transporter [Escherichia coli]